MLAFKSASSASLFQSTPPVRGATISGRQTNGYLVSGFQSTPPVRGATGSPENGTLTRVFQSTPPVRGATRRTKRRTTERCFNPRPPCGERRRVLRPDGTFWLFQSTPPVRGATQSLGLLPAPNRSFNPRPPCGERHLGPLGGRVGLGVSIHAPRAGSDPRSQPMGWR